MKDPLDNQAVDWCEDRINTSDVILLNQEIENKQSSNFENKSLFENHYHTDSEFLDLQKSYIILLKKNEILQMAVLEPKLAILDETDSGLDRDATKIVFEGVQKLKNDNNALLIITHYNKVLDYLKPDFVHILMDGRIVKSGGIELVEYIEKNGYQKMKEELGL